MMSVASATQSAQILDMQLTTRKICPAQPMVYDAFAGDVSDVQAAIIGAIQLR
jgi:hypothetical protein